MKKYSILMLMSKYHAVSGHTRVVDSLCIELEKMGHKVTLGSFDFKKEPPPKISKLELNRINVTNTINKGDYDIIHNHQTLMNYYLLFVNKPIIFHYHGASSLIQKINLKISSIICNKKILKIISISESAKNEIKKYFFNTSNIVVYNGVNTNFYKNSGNASFKKGNPQLFFVGNLFEYKNIQFLINIFPKIIQNYPDIHFQIVGKGEFKDNLIKLVKELKLGKKIEFVGRINDDELKKYYSSSDIYITASKWEFFNLPLLESMSCGKPILVSELPVHREIILKSKAGEIFEMNEKNLILKINNIIKNYDQFSQNARKFALENDWNHAAVKISSVYRELI